MICSVCQEPNPTGAQQCLRCSSILPPARPAARAVAAAPSRTPAAAPAGAGPAAGSVAPSAAVPDGAMGPRYEIVRLLGRGAMGAVYLARDRELGREVAVKVIAPHLAGDPAVLERFKREIQLSTRVTHANVLRVFDLGESGERAFLTMQYVDGGTLADALRRESPMAPDRALGLFRQVLSGLAAAHGEGIVHRDLKPANVLMDADGHAYVTDFGLATAAGVAPLTQSGAPAGTPQYMSPEQVKGEPADARSDVFAAGVMLYEMLAGAAPFAGESVYAVMMARMLARPRPIREVNPAVPEAVARVIARCLAVDPAERFPSAAEVLQALEPGAAPTRLPRRRAGPARRVPWRRWALAPAAVLALALAGAAAWRLWPRPPAPARTEKVLVADFENRTGEEVFTGTLEPALGLALEGASFITAFNRNAARRTADQLGIEGSGLTERRARLVAQREGVGIVVAGAVDREPSGFRVAVRAVDAFTGQRVLEDAVLVTGKEDVLAATTRLAARLRNALGDVTPEGVQLREGETFGATSLEAAHDYAEGMKLQYDGRWDEAAKRYLAALERDPSMGRAHTALAVLEMNRGRHAEAERYHRRALALVDRMSEREKFRTRGAYYLFVRDMDKAIEVYRALVAKYPSDTAGLANLALAHVWKGDFARGLEESRKAIAVYPRNVPQRNNVGLFAMYAGDFEAAVREQLTVLELNPRFVNGYIGLALAQLASGRPAESAATWRRLEALGPAESSAAAEGLADLALFEGRLADARAILDEGLRADRARGDGEAAARKLAVLAEVHLALGEPARAAAAAEEAARRTSAEHVLYLAAVALAEAGRDRPALKLADELGRHLEPLPRLYAEVVRARLDLRRGRASEAIARLEGGLKLFDWWLVHLALARAHLEAGRPEQAADELAACVRRRGEVTDVFIDNVPTYRLYAPVAYWQGRVAEARGSPAAAEAYRSFLARAPSGEGPLVRDARRRLEGR